MVETVHANSDRLRQGGLTTNKVVTKLFEFRTERWQKGVGNKLKGKERKVFYSNINKAKKKKTRLGSVSMLNKKNSICPPPLHLDDPRQTTHGTYSTTSSSSPLPPLIFLINEFLQRRRLNFLNLLRYLATKALVPDTRSAISERSTSISVLSPNLLRVLIIRGRRV